MLSGAFHQVKSVSACAAALFLHSACAPRPAAPAPSAAAYADPSARPAHQASRPAIGFTCPFCHNAYPAPAPASVFDEPAFPAIPEGIDCQRCHGPGRLHADLAAAPNTPKDAIRAAILNPARLA